MKCPVGFAHCTGEENDENFSISNLRARTVDVFRTCSVKSGTGRSGYWPDEQLGNEQNGPKHEQAFWNEEWDDDWNEFRQRFRDDEVWRRPR